MNKTLKGELQNIISGDGQVRFGSLIQSVNRFIRREKGAILGIETPKLIKKQEEIILSGYIQRNSLWIEAPDVSKYIGEGAEQKIFEHEDPKFVTKLNSGIFYVSWEDYFNSLLLHNYFFPHLAYELLGFALYEEKLHSVVKQAYVYSTETTKLSRVKEFLGSNGFIHRKANDYFHPELGIILEDLHDENVLTENGILQCIDTVFYITPHFYA